MRREYYEPILSQAHQPGVAVFRLPVQARRRNGRAYLDRLAAELEAEFQRVGPDTVIAFLAEPVVGATTGCVTAIPGYFQARAGDLRSLTARC